MRKYLFATIFFALTIFVGIFWYVKHGESVGLRYSDTEIGFEEVADTTSEPNFSELESVEETTEITPRALFETVGGRIHWGAYWRDFSPEEEKLYGSWVRPPGPLRVGVQAGHAELENVPEELSGLRQSSGAFGGGKTEAEVVLVIAEKVKKLLEAEGIVVDLLPATIPAGYSADAFVSIHADGNNSPSVSGFKISGPNRDFSGRAEDLVNSLYESYGSATKLRKDSSITRRMSGYYAFNWRRYEHAVHPMTPSVIIETGFITSPTDRAIIVSNADRAAEGIALGIINFLKT